MNLEELGIWGKDKIVRDDGKTYAQDYACIRCHREGKLTRADNFWPCIDPDIPSYPYCSDCVKELNIEVLIQMVENK